MKRTSVTTSKWRRRPSGYTCEIAVGDEAIAAAQTTMDLFGMHTVFDDEQRY